MDVSHIRLCKVRHRLAMIFFGRRIGAGRTYVNPSVLQLTTKVPSRLKSMPLTGSLCAGKLLIKRPARTSHRNTASS